MQVQRLKNMTDKGMTFEKDGNRYLVEGTTPQWIVAYLLTVDQRSGHYVRTNKKVFGRLSNCLVGFRPIHQKLKDCFMSKVEAYLCDSCGEIRGYEAVIGFSPERDLFDQRESFKEIDNPAKASYHYCTDCFHSKVYVPAINTTDRAKDEGAYRSKVKELLFVLKNQALMKAKK